MARMRLFSAFLLCVQGLGVPGAAQVTPECQLCAPAQSAQKPGTVSNAKKALSIRIDNDLEFGVAALGPAPTTGTIAIDPVTDLRVVSGGLVDLGGIAFRGTARLSGEPFARVRISLPTVEVMNNIRGAKAEIRSISADVPDIVTLDAAGQRVFNFAGRFHLLDRQSGIFHGKVQVSATYE